MPFIFTWPGSRDMRIHQTAGDDVEDWDTRAQGLESRGALYVTIRGQPAGRCCDTAVIGALPKRILGEARYSLPCDFITELGLSVAVGVSVLNGFHFLPRLPSCKARV